MRVMRKNYDKPNRCPSWSGPAWKGETRTECEGGSTGYYLDNCNEWNFHRCKKCGVWTLPFSTRWVDPAWVVWYVRKSY